MNNDYIFGMRPIMEALTAGKGIEKVLMKQGLEGSLYGELIDLLHNKNVPYQFVPVEKLNTISKGARHQGVAAYISKIEYISLEDMVAKAQEKSKLPLLILLDGVSDVRNFGAIARSAECAGADGIILPAKGGAAINADAIKSSAGALMRIDTCKVPNLRTAVFYLLEQGFEVIASTEKSENTIYDVNFNNPTAIIMGAEDKGISDSLLAFATQKAKIPMGGEIGSLNVSVATAIVLFEALRQRRDEK